MKYYLLNNNQQSGPFDISELPYKGLNASSMVWCEGMSGWLPASCVPEVASLLNKVPPTPNQYPPQPPQVGPNNYQQNYAYAQNKSVSFGDAIKICFNKYADFDGRATPSEFWFFILFNFIVSFVTFGFGSIVTFLPTLAVGSRRLHDTGRSGWFQLLYLVPLANLILIVWWIEASHDNNQYGPRP